MGGGPLSFSTLALALATFAFALALSFPFALSFALSLSFALATRSISPTAPGIVRRQLPTSDLRCVVFLLYAAAEHTKVLESAISHRETRCSQ